MLQFNWTHTTITDKTTANTCFAFIKKQPKTIAAFDTETTGLHLTLDKPFVYQFGFVNEKTMQGYTYVVDLSMYWELGLYVIRTWHTFAKLFKKYIGANVKFDLHMLLNINCPYVEDNISDVEFIIRYAHDTLHISEGGPPLELKKYATMYIDTNANIPEKAIKTEQSYIAKQYNNKLKNKLVGCGTPPPEFNARSYTLGVITEIFKDKVFDYNDLWEPVKSKYIEWYKEIPEAIRNKMTEGLVRGDDIPYYMVNRSTLIRYAHLDIVYTLEIWYKLYPTLVARDNEIGVKFEEKTIYPLLKMERTGFLADKEYLENARIKMKKYILNCRKELADKAGQSFKVGQHEFIKNLLKNKYGLDIKSTQNSELELILSDLIRKKVHKEVISFIEALQELRTLEKWYSVYILRFQRDLKNTDRLYTQIHQVGAVSGRVTSDFQQFPKKGICTRTGEELFHPRRIIKAETGIVYLDYSQIELRFQALYTILVGYPDLNLCRAYMPYKCVNKDGVEFDYNNIEHIKNWNKEWYYLENPDIRWIPTDVHGATTTAATGLKPSDPEFKSARSTIGKRTNFAKNYGAQYRKICEMFPDKSPAECRKIDNAYYTAFPGVKEYHRYCQQMCLNQSFVPNLFNVKYYGTSGHKLINLLIQGSAAYYLKLKIKQIDDYLTKHKYKTRIQMQIHDELSFIYHPDDPVELFFEIQSIMQDWNETLVPIVADMEVTNTYWSEKKDVETVEELRLYLKPRPIG